MAFVATTASVLRYRDLDAAVNWLDKAFGLERQKEIANDAGALEYAELRCGTALFLLSRVGHSELDRLMVQPDQTGGAGTQTSYLLVEDADAHCARAREAGATILVDVSDDVFGGRSYVCRDLEGHLWNFGTRVPISSVRAASLPPPLPAKRRRPRARAGVVLLGLVALAALAFAGWTYGRFGQSAGLIAEWQRAASQSSEEVRTAQARLAVEQKLRAVAEDAQRQTSALLVAAREAKIAAEAAARNVTAERDRLAAARADAEQQVAKIQQAAKKEAEARIAAEHAAEIAKQQLARQLAAAEADAKVRREDRATAEKLSKTVEDLRADLAREATMRQQLEARVAELAAQRDEALKAREILAVSADRDRQELAQELEAKRKALEALSRERLAAQSDSTNDLRRDEEEMRSAEHRSASAETPTDGQLGQVEAKERAQQNRKEAETVDLVSLYRQLGQSPDSRRTAYVRSRLRTMIATSKDVAQLSRFINTVGEGPFVDFAKRRAQSLRKQQPARAGQEQHPKPSPALAEQRQLLRNQKAYVTSRP